MTRALAISLFTYWGVLAGIYQGDMPQTVHIGSSAVTGAYYGDVAVLASGDASLIGHWPMADNADDYVVADTSANVNDGVTSSFTSVMHTAGPGSPGPASALAVINPDTLIIPNHAAYSVFSAGTFTICAWVRVPSTPATYAAILGQVDGWLLYVTAGEGVQYINIYDGASDHRDDRGLTSGAWHFFAVTVQGGACVLYVNAVGATVFNVSGFPDNSGNYLSGNDPRVATTGTDAAVADLRVYSRVLSAQDLATIMGGGEPPPGSGESMPPPATITVQFDPGSGYADYLSAEYVPGAQFGPLPNAYNYDNNYSFSYWRDGSWNMYNEYSTVPSGNITLYAEYYYSGP